MFFHEFVCRLGRGAQKKCGLSGGATGREGGGESGVEGVD
jgi:hypothetical protein